MQFFDAHYPIDRICRGGKSPWIDEQVMTIVGTARIVMRRRLPSGQIVVRTLLAQELLALQGWSSLDYVGGPHTGHPQSLLIDLAGNAFNAFAAGIVCLAAIAAMHLPPVCNISKGSGA